MSLQVEKKEKNMAVLTIEVPAEEFEAAIEKAYQKNKGKIQIPGFRKFSSEYLETVASAKRENAAEKFGQFLTDGSDADRIDFSDTVNMFRLQRIWLIKGIRTKWIPPGHLFPKGFRPLQRGVQQTRNSLRNIFRRHWNQKADL